jgi:hypothetical protein
VFYRCLEVIQNDDCGIILQTTVQGQTIQIDPLAISTILGVPVLPISAKTFYRDFGASEYRAAYRFLWCSSQGDEQAHPHI